MKVTNPFLNLVNQIPSDGMMYAGGSPNFNEMTGQYTTAPPPPPANPFAGLAGSLPQSGYASPDAQAYLQQALTNPYMQGWGQPQAPAPAAPGNTGIVPPGTGTGTGTPGNIPLTGAPAQSIGQQFLDAQNAKRKQKNAEAIMNFGGAVLGGANPVLGMITMGGQAIANTIKGPSLYGTNYGYKDIRPYMLQQGFTTQQAKGKASTLYYWTDPSNGKKIPVTKKNRAAWDAWHAAFANSVAALDAKKRGG